MKKWMISLLVVLIFSTVTVEAATPEYAKWGKIAVEETQKRYNADIIDYKHIGRKDITPKKSEEKFKLWISPTTETIHSIRFSETNR